MKFEPIITIIIPTYNSAKYIEETIKSIQTQNYTQWECLVIDDGSNDNTATIVRKYEDIDDRIKFFIRPSTYKSGGNGSRNYGLDIAQGEYIQWFDSDDVMCPDFLSRKMDFADSNVVFCNYKLVSEDLSKGLEDVNISIDFNSILEDIMLWKPHVRCVTLSGFFRKSYLLENELRFNEELLRSQDREFLFRLFCKAKATDFAIVDDYLFLYRQHNNSKTSKKDIYETKYVNDYIYLFLSAYIYAIQHTKPKVAQIAFYQLVNLMIFCKPYKDNNYEYILNGILNREGINEKFSYFVATLYRKTKYNNRFTQAIFKKIMLFK